MSTYQSFEVELLLLMKAATNKITKAIIHAGLTHAGILNINPFIKIAFIYNNLSIFSDFFKKVRELVY